MLTSHGLIEALQWLNERTFEVLAVTALLAFAAEWIANTRGGAEPSAATTATRTKRWRATWGVNVALMVITLCLSWALAPWLTTLFSDALSAKSGLLALLNIGPPTDFAHIVLGVVLLDLLTYAMHRLMHVVPFLWRIHQVHHSDADMNASTHFRQHPAQMLVLLAVQLPAVWLLGISGLSWVFYSALGLVTQLWQHASLPEGARVERYVGWLFVTPRFHRTHHEQRRDFHDTNYGALFSVWDRLLATSSHAPDALRVGLANWSDGKRASLIELLRMPFTPSVSADQAITQRNGTSLPKTIHSQNQGKI
jgi:sterol desaturase/sphingolipid hydroxylase (fatty acid hydroxylase superfamily)